jgi:hypothetical protein
VVEDTAVVKLENGSSSDDTETQFRGVIVNKVTVSTEFHMTYSIRLIYSGKKTLKNPNPSYLTAVKLKLYAPWYENMILNKIKQ